MGMKLSQLRTFVAIAEHGGFARGAARLNLTQPATSRQISSLESELGVPLFDRIGRRIRLTSEGEDCCAIAVAWWTTSRQSGSGRALSRRAKREYCGWEPRRKSSRVYLRSSCSVTV